MVDLRRDLSVPTTGFDATISETVAGKALAELAEWPVGDARHRRHSEIVRQVVGTDAHGGSCGGRLIREERGRARYTGFGCAPIELARSVPPAFQAALPRARRGFRAASRRAMASNTENVNGRTASTKPIAARSAGIERRVEVSELVAFGRGRASLRNIKSCDARDTWRTRSARPRPAGRRRAA